MFRHLLLTFAFLLPFSQGFAQGNSHTKAELLSEVSALAPGKAVTFGIHFKMEKDWHLYWANPGDSGMAPSVKWTLPKGFEAGEILWPIPEKLQAPEGVDYIYNNEVVLLVPMKIPAKLKTEQKVKVTAQVSWLACHEACIPGEAKLSLTLSIRNRRLEAALKTRDLFIKARENLPGNLPEGWSAFAVRKGGSFRLSMETPSPLLGAVFFPLHPGQVENAASQQFKLEEKGFELSLKRSSEAPAVIETLEGLLLAEEKKGVKKGYVVKAKLFIK